MLMDRNIATRNGIRSMVNIGENIEYLSSLPGMQTLQLHIGKTS